MSSGQSWTDIEKLAYFIMIFDNGQSIDWKKVPIPAGRSVKACQRMVQNTKDKLKDDIERLKSGAAAPDTSKEAKSPKKAVNKNGASKPKSATKKKVDGDETGVKKGTKRAQSADDDDDDEGFDQFVGKKIKIEPKYEEVEQYDDVDDVA
ncbi:hypothetical protein BU16DRAFT_590406 [Lophium mytilinum]|uniref:Uncharacterized protein n=1 Tax=Lophium mytilinum TaxID=390894 RepID=A0A6A6QPV8_9PEZI|nr:hypothetical protein BU16DRAFT_590406 [Lophium mytilinum]